MPILIDDFLVPKFRISEKLSPALGDLKDGQKIRAIMTYTVIECTKSFKILRIDYLQPFPTKRTY